VKKTGVIVTIVFVVVFSLVRMSVWWHSETAKGHHLSFASPRNWGFYSLQSETQAAYPPGQRDENRITDMRQYGPITDYSDNPAYVTGK